MNGLRSAGRALAIRHMARATLAIAGLAKSLGFLWRSGRAGQANLMVTASWFPLFPLFAAAPLLIFDRTAGSESGPLLQLDRPPEVQVTARALSLSSTIWPLTIVLLYLLHRPIRHLLFD